MVPDIKIVVKVFIHLVFENLLEELCALGSLSNIFIGGVEAAQKALLFFHGEGESIAVEGERVEIGSLAPGLLEGISRL